MKFLRASKKELLVYQDPFPHYVIGDSGGMPILFPLHPNLVVPAGVDSLDVAIGITAGGGVVITPPKKDPDDRALVHLDRPPLPNRATPPSHPTWEKAQGKSRVLSRCPVHPHERPVALLATGWSEESAFEHLVIMEPLSAVIWKDDHDEVVLYWNGKKLLPLSKEDWYLAIRSSHGAPRGSLLEEILCL